MKKLFVFAAVAAFALSMTSCKKDWTCTCTTDVAGITASASTTINDTKSNAEETCEAGSVSSSFGSTTCAID